MRVLDLNEPHLRVLAPIHTKQLRPHGRLYKARHLLALATAFVSLSSLFPNQTDAASRREARNSSKSDTLHAAATFNITDDGWNTSTSTSDCATGQGDDDWSLTLTNPASLTVTATDGFCVGDYFEIFVDEKSLGVTPNPGAWGCSASGTLSSGSFTTALDKGTHSIKVRDHAFDGHSPEEISDEGMCPAGFNVAGAISSSIRITSPEKDKSYLYNNATFNGIDAFVYTATGESGKPIAWDTVLSYSPSKGRGPFEKKATFTTESGVSNTTPLKSQGGQLKVSARQGSNTAEVTAYITGTAVPKATIASKLSALYSGATKNLMVGLASHESRCLQFESQSLYGIRALWPTASHADGGSHIGIMQISLKPTSDDKVNRDSMLRAWDWNANGEAGVAWFGVKRKYARALIKKVIASHPGLRQLSATEEENWTIANYGQFSGVGADHQYYIPVCVKGTVVGKECKGKAAKWDWAENSKGNPGGIAYTKDVRVRANFLPACTKG